MALANKSILFDGGKPDLYDGSIEYPDSEAFFPGTLFSFQPGHPEHGIQGSITTGMTIKNAARRTAGKLMGVSAANLNTLDGVLTIGSDTASDRFKLEMTPMGGLHVINSLELGGANTYFQIKMPNAIKQRIFDYSARGVAPFVDVEANHRYAIALWLMATRLYRTDSGKVGNNQIISGIVAAGDADGVPTFGTIQAGAHSPSYPLTGVEDTGTTPSSYGTSANLIGTMGLPAIAPSVGVPNFRWMATQGWFNSQPANIAAFDGLVIGGGVQPGQSASGFLQAAMSFIVYRADFIDLYAYGFPRGEAFRGHSGIGFAHGFSDIYGQRDQHIAAFNRAFAPGGIHYNDAAPTAPASIP